MSGMDLGRLKVSLRTQLVIRHRAEVTRARKAIERLTDQARRAITAAKTEGAAYEALQHYTRMLAWLRGVPLDEVKS